jgi:hypothetical protein
MRLAGLTQMNMQIDQSRRDNAAARVESLVGLPVQFSRRRHGGHPAIAQQHVHVVINAAGRVNHPSALYE